ncbi:hypothetical protein BAUCODRAFT_146720 [Baudoinia panamericana UAMH 10762]|uniref:Uncharacterized protein n=1 Tax=Baudoinia panamericana (strain UAMH 10762) TaxID=717646 RepID=M2LUB5_BAUPA|nr:uncharacterized protein BAUCODRAFT_146720 [Baudoinia panamericana UAMH 10762]EMC98152.1 hypothetical protein BAUCODRAFT_146720 [Baudoinia panamericana UAMH 10762]
MTADHATTQFTKVQDVVQNYRPSKLFKAPPTTTYTSIDFDDTGEFLLLSRSDDTIQLYNAKAGAHAKELKSQKYGTALARFTHHPMSVLYASTKIDDGIRYLSMHDNNFIRYFKGHQGRVTSLCLSPSGDHFLSGSLDNTVKLWDFRSPHPQGELSFDAAPYLVAYDPSASVIAIASTPAQQILLYDLKNYDKPPFAEFDLLETEKKYIHLGQRPAEGWTGIEFSNNGKYMLISTNGPGHYLIDAFSGDLIHYLHRPSGNTHRLAPGDVLLDGNASYVQADACFTPDGRYVVGAAGSSKPGLLVWDAQEPEGKGRVLEPTVDLPCTKPAAVVAHNPRHNQLASADKELVMWLPDMDLT